MRFNEFRIVEAEQPGYYTVGDSHAVGMANYAGRPWINKGKNGMKSTEPMHMAAINSIPSGSVVVISAGGNDALNVKTNPNATAATVKSLVDAAVAKGLKVTYLLFPVGTRPNSEHRAKTREAIKSALSGVKIIDLEGSRLVDGVHANASAYKSAAQEVMTGTKPDVKGGAAQAADTSAKNGSGELGTLRAGPPYPPEQEPAVKAMQDRLEELGYSVGSTGSDGKYGPRTTSAVRAFKKDNLLKGDGLSMSASDIEKLKTAPKAEHPSATGNSDSAGSSAAGATADMDAVEMIKKFEGYGKRLSDGRVKAYWDVKQYSIGYGTKANSPTEIIDEKEAENRLMKFIERFANHVESINRKGNYNWNEGQKGALISFAYNIGSINQLTDNGKRSNKQIAKMMLKYINSGGKPETGLIRRRKVEQEKFVNNTPELKNGVV